MFFFKFVKMLKLKFYGHSFSYFKFKKTNNQFVVGYQNLFFFFLLLTSQLLVTVKSLTVQFYKNHNKSQSLRKAYFKYKITKHKITYHSYSFLIRVIFQHSNMMDPSAWFNSFYQLIKIFKMLNYWTSPLWIITHQQWYYNFSMFSFFHYPINSISQKFPESF